MVQPLRTFGAEHLPSGRTHVFAYIGYERVIVFSMLTRDYWKLSEKDVRDAIAIALNENRPPLKVRRPT